MSRKKQDRISTEELKNLKTNMRRMAEEGMEVQKKAIRDQFSYVFSASSLSEKTARYIARRLGIGFETLCEKPEEKKKEKEPVNENDVAGRLNAFVERTGVTGQYVANVTGLTRTPVSLLRRRKRTVSAKAQMEKTLSALPETAKEIMSEKPETLIALFEESARENMPEKTKQKIRKKEEEKEREKQTNLEYYSRVVTERACEFVQNNRQTAARATMNALRTVIPKSADTPAKVLTWLSEEHRDRFVLSKAEKAMLDGYFRMHKNALSTLFEETYMYASKKESGMFADIPGDITLEYLRDHTAKGDEKNG